MALAVVGHILTLRIDDNGGIVVLGVSRPLERGVYLLRIAGDDGTVMLESCGARPERANTGAWRFQERCYLLQRLEVVSLRYGQLRWG